MRTKTMSLQKILGIAVICLLALVMTGYALVQYGLLNPREAGLIVQKLRKPDFHYYPWIYVIDVHIVTACLAMLTGPFGLFVKPKGRWIKPHRIMGYIYICSIMLSGILSVYLSFFASGGWKAGTGFFFLDVMWMSTTWIGLMKILKKQVQSHKEWMIRSYAMTFAAVTFRLWLIALQSAGVASIPAYQWSAWVCWIPNLLIIEWWIRTRRNKLRSQRAMPPFQMNR